MTTQDEVLKQNAVFLEQYRVAFETAKAAPGGLAPEALALFERAMADHVEWMASHGILFPDQVMGR